MKRKRGPYKPQPPHSAFKVTTQPVRVLTRLQMIAFRAAMAKSIRVRA